MGNEKKDVTAVPAKSVQTKQKPSFIEKELTKESNDKIAKILVDNFGPGTPASANLNAKCDEYFLTAGNIAKTTDKQMLDVVLPSAEKIVPAEVKKQIMDQIRKEIYETAEYKAL